MNKAPISIENWAVVESVSMQGWSPLEPGRRLTGYVSGHTDLPAGFIYTSAIVNIDEAAGLVETRNNVYRLGRRSADYDVWLRRQQAARAA
jgi:hypothetical protein